MKQALKESLSEFIDKKSVNAEVSKKEVSIFNPR